MGYYLTYTNKNGVFGFCGLSASRPPFDCRGHALIFPSRKEARCALKQYREVRGITHLKPYAAQHYAIVPIQVAYINNK